MTKENLKNDKEKTKNVNCIPDSECSWCAATEHYQQLDCENVKNQRTFLCFLMDIISEFSMEDGITLIKYCIPKGIQKNIENFIKNVKGIRLEALDQEFLKKGYIREFEIITYLISLEDHLDLPDFNKIVDMFATVTKQDTDFVKKNLVQLLAEYRSCYEKAKILSRFS